MSLLGVDTQFVNCAPDEALGAEAYFRLTFQPSTLEEYLPGTASSLQAAAQSVYQRLAGTGLAYPISNNPLAPGATRATFDIKTASTAQNATVGQLLDKIDAITSPAHLIGEIERIPKSRTSATARTQDRQAALARADTREQQRGPGSWWDGLTGWLHHLFGELKMAAVVVLIVAMVALAFYLHHKHRHASAAA